MAPDSRDRRAVSITVNHVFAIGITTVLLVGLFASFGGFVDSHIRQSGEKELRVIGERIAAEIQVADRIARDGGKVSLRVTQPPRVSSGTYTVRLLHGSVCDTSRFTAETCLRLHTSVDPVTVMVPVANVTAVRVRSVGSGTFVITAGVGSGSATASGDVAENIGVDVGVGRGVRAPSGSGNYTFQNRPPVAKFNYSPSNPSVGSIIRFNSTATDVDGSITKYEWDLDGDGSVEKTGESFNYSYTEPGKYNATLTVTDDQGETDTVSVLIVVSGLVYNYDATAADYDGDGVPGGVNFSVTNLHGDVTVTYVSIEPHNDNITGIDVDVPGNDSGETELYFAPTSGSDQHVDDTLDLTGDGVIVDLSYSKSSGEVQFGSGEVMDVHFSEFRRSGGAPIDMDERKVDVAIRYYVDSGGTRNYSVAKFTLFTNRSRNNPPIPSFSASCSGKTCQFDPSGSSDADGNIVSYNWTFGDGATGGGNPVTHTYGSNGTYQVTLTVTDDNGTSTSVTKTVLVGAVDFDLKVNFQPPGVPTPPGYVADTGEVYGSRGNGYTYGWDASADRRVDRDYVADQKLDTFISMQHSSYGSDRVWEAKVPDGTYRVYLVMGDEHYAYDDSVVVEGEPIADPDTYEWSDHDRYVTVAEVNDGRLTIRPGPGAQDAKINYVHVTRVDSRAYQEDGGRVVVEAEHFQDVRQGNDDDNGPGNGDDMSGTSFVPESEPAASGKTLQVRPDLEENADDTRNGQRLDFQVDFDTTGTYYVWIRMKCSEEADDSVHVGLDGDAVTLGGYGLTVGCDGAGGYTWVHQQYDPPPGGWDTTPVTVQVNATGVHTFNVWVREDGVYVDKIILTTTAPTAYTPSGKGPKESNQS